MPGARRSDEGDDLARVDRGVDVAKRRRLSALITERDVDVFDAPAHRRQRNRAGRIADFDGQIEQLEDAAGSDDRLADVAEKGRDAIHRVHQVHQQAPVHEDSARVEPADQDLADGEPHDGDDRGNHDRRNDERLRLNELRQLHVRAEEIVVSVAKASDFELFAPERFDDSLASENLRQVCGEIGYALLRAMRARRNQALEVRDGKRNDRRDQHERERQEPVEIDHRRERRNEGGERDDELRHRDAHRIDHHLQVGRKARDELAGTPLVELAKRQVQQAGRRAARADARPDAGRSTP